LFGVECVQQGASKASIGSDGSGTVSERSKDCAIHARNGI
jgi:hypothetical protein